MRQKACVVAMIIATCVLLSSTAMACHSNYFNEMFLTLKKMKSSNELTSDQISSMWDLTGKFEKTWKTYASAGRPSSSLNPVVNDFVAAAAGVLDSKQYTKLTGKKKTEVQELRFEVNQLRKEITEIKNMLKALKASSK